MKKIDTISDVCEILLEFEKKNKLFEMKVEEIYLWKLIRFSIFKEITIKLGIYKDDREKIKISKIDLIKKMTYNFLQNNKKFENLVFSHNRFFLDNKVYKDVHSYKIIETLKSVEVIYPVSMPLKFINKNYNYSFIETIGLVLKKLEIKTIKSKISININESLKIKNLKKELEDKFCFKIEELEIEKIERSIKKFKLEKEYYLKFLNKKVPKNIYIVCSYGKESLISAAENLGINVIEIQHGVMNKYHLGYHYPNDKEIPYFPKKILMFSEYWYNILNLPLKKENIEFIGYPYLEKQLNKYRGIEKKNKQVLFVSQGTIGKKLTERAVLFAQRNKDIQVIVRLHPGEFSRWREDYTVLFKNKELLNLKISDNNDKNLYEYLIESEYIICVYSTVIYEALQLNKKIGILNLSGIEYVEDLIKENIIYKFDKEIDLKKLELLKQNKINYF